MSVTIVNVTGLDPEDYYAKTGEAAVASRLAAEHGATKVGGGTCFATGESDMDFEVPEGALAAFLAALDAAGLTHRKFDAAE